MAAKNRGTVAAAGTSKVEFSKGAVSRTGMAKGIIKRLLGVALILTLGALTTHAIAHWHAQDSAEKQCQICQAGHAATSQTAAPGAIQAPFPVARFVVPEHFVVDLEPARTPSIPRGPPA